MHRLLLTCLAVCTFACEPERPSEAPLDVVGVWATEGARYADRYLEIRKRTITFGTGDHGSVTHTIVAVEPSPGEPEGATHYEITYADHSGERSRIGLTIQPTRPVPTLQLDHRDEKWFLRLHKPGEAPG